MQVKTCIFLISRWFNMLSTLVKNGKFCKLFFVLSLILLAVFIENLVDVVHLGAQQGYKHSRKYTPFVGAVRIDQLERKFFSLYAFLGLCYLNINFLLIFFHHHLLPHTLLYLHLLPYTHNLPTTLPTTLLSMSSFFFFSFLLNPLCNLNF